MYDPIFALSILTQNSEKTAWLILLAGLLTVSVPVKV